MQRDYVAIIWPTGYRYRDEIRGYYVESGRILSVSDIIPRQFSSREHFLRFIYDVYAEDDLPKGILRTKAEIISRHRDLLWGVFTFSCGSDIDDSLIDEVILGLKTTIRNTIAEKMDDYFYDNLFHVSDTKMQYNMLKTLLSQYGVEIK